LQKYETFDLHRRKLNSYFYQLDLEILVVEKARSSNKTNCGDVFLQKKKYTKTSLANIGSQIGDRDHATVLPCKTEQLVATDKQFKS
jgi:chromosomal replication initiator protein